MTLEEMQVKAEQIFMKRFHWSQAVLVVGQKKLGKGNKDSCRYDNYHQFSKRKANHNME